MKSNPFPTINDSDDGPAINLRGSFEELEKSFNSNLNEEALNRVFGDNDVSNKKMQGEIDRRAHQGQ
jgi:hypothetical protein